MQTVLHFRNQLAYSKESSGLKYGKHCSKFYLGLDSRKFTRYHMTVNQNNVKNGLWNKFDQLMLILKVHRSPQGSTPWSSLGDGFGTDRERGAWFQHGAARLTDAGWRHTLSNPWIGLGYQMVARSSVNLDRVLSLNLRQSTLYPLKRLT